MRFITRGKWYLDLLDDIKYIFREIKYFIFYIFNKRKVNNKLLANKELAESLKKIGIENKIKLYHTIISGEDLAAFNNFSSWEEFYTMPLGNINAAKKLGVNIK